MLPEKQNEFCTVFDPVTFLSIVVGLFSLINPISILPVYISLTREHTEANKLRTLKKTCLYIFLICFLAYFAGLHLLNIFGISIQALRVSGGLIIFRSGWQLLHLRHKEEVKTGQAEDEGGRKEDISFTPLAMPLLAGPGAMSFLITLYANRSADPSDAFWQDISVVLASLSVSISIYFLYRMAPLLLKFTGKSGLDSLSKIMGFVVTGVGVQMILSSLTTILPELLKLR